MIGLDSAGKTSILYRLKTGKEVPECSTIGFNVESFSYKGLNFTFLDVGGQDKLRVLWKQYYKTTHGIIYVVDSSDSDRIEDAAEELKKFLSEQELKNCVVLIMANKQDLNRALKPDVVEEKMGIKQIQGITYHVVGTSDVTGEGIKEGLDWLVSVLQKK